MLEAFIISIRISSHLTPRISVCKDTLFCENKNKYLILLKKNSPYQVVKESVDIYINLCL